MESFLIGVNLTLARLCTPLALLLCIIVILRLAAKGRDKKTVIFKVNRWLRKAHVPLAKVLLFFVVVHTILSFAGFTEIKDNFFGFMWGIVCLVFIILLFLNFKYRKKFKPNWMYWHRILAVGFVISLLLHVFVIENGGH